MGLVLLLCVGALVSAFQHPHRHDDAAEKVALCILIALLTALLIRIWRTGTLEATASGVVVRTLGRTHRMSWAEVRSVEEVVRVVGASGIRRRVLRVNFSDGRHRDFLELNCPTRLVPDVVADTAAYLNAIKPKAELG